MKIWTALQQPLSQAVMVEDGRIVKSIPDHPPKTPARLVSLVSQYDDKLIIGRRNNLEIWDKTGNELIHLIYHPWFYSLHDSRQLGRNLLLGCGTLDAVLEVEMVPDVENCLADDNAHIAWSWWAFKDGYAAEPTFIHDDDWQIRQLTQNISHDTAHLNSVHPIDARTMLVTLLVRKSAVEINKSQPSKIIAWLPDDPHDCQFIDGELVYGYRQGICIGDQKHEGYKWVKRIKKKDDLYVFSHETGITGITRDGTVKFNWSLPRPFGIVFAD